MLGSCLETRRHRVVQGDLKVHTYSRTQRWPPLLIYMLMKQFLTAAVGSRVCWLPKCLLKDYNVHPMTACLCTKVSCMLPNITMLVSKGFPKSKVYNASETVRITLHDQSQFLPCRSRNTNRFGAVAVLVAAIPVVNYQTWMLGYGDGTERFSRLCAGITLYSCSVCSNFTIS